MVMKNSPMDKNRRWDSGLMGLSGGGGGRQSKSKSERTIAEHEQEEKEKEKEAKARALTYSQLTMYVERHFKYEMFGFRCYACVAAAIGLAASIMESEILTSRMNKPNDLCNWLKLATTCTTVMLLCCIIKIYHLRVKVGICSGRMHSQTTLFTGSIQQPLLLELLVCCLHSNIPCP
jgi:hypothetical protein